MEQTYPVSARALPPCVRRMNDPPRLKLHEVRGASPIIGRANPVVGARHDDCVSNTAQNSRKHLERLHLSIVPARHAAHLRLPEKSYPLGAAT
jgi:hypothetical protein